jgi:ferrous iron transport protein B
MALAIPCSAQLGVIFALLAGHTLAMVLWMFIMILIFMGVGALAARVLPGDKPLFYMELPPLRMPKPSNVFLKTWTRVVWYFREIMPLFILASLILWLGNLTGAFQQAVRMLEKPLALIGLPPQMGKAVIYGFFRRDYGAAGLYDLKQAGVISGVPLLTAVVMLSLFIPCIAQFSITAKERGLKTAIAMAAFIFPFAFLVAGLVYWTLTGLGVRL